VTDVPTPIVDDPAAVAAAAIDEAAAHPTVAGPPPQVGTPMSDDTRAWLEANASLVWVVAADPA
jgi:hypothetical protein